MTHEALEERLLALEDAHAEALAVVQQQLASIRTVQSVVCEGLAMLTRQLAAVQKPPETR